MDVRTCKMCKGLYNYIGGRPLCAKCIDELENKFQEVKEYINENPTAGIGQVAEENGIPISQIKLWVKEERLSFTSDSLIGIECESCGKTIKTGRFCERCKSELQSGLENSVKKAVSVQDVKKKEAARMRFLDGK